MVVITKKEMAKKCAGRFAVQVVCLLGLKMFVLSFSFLFQKILFVIFFFFLLLGYDFEK